jgi:protein involved in polysaccharide export with SLBB domain
MRKSVAAQQKQALNFALLQLQKQAYMPQAITPEQASIQASQATFVDKFVQAASAVTPTGIVAVYRDGNFQDLHLQEGDQIIMPNKTDVVIVAGEVLAPGALAHRDRATIRDYVRDSGGYTEQADTSDFVLQGLDGSSRVARESDVPRNGDVIMVVPEPPDTTFELVRSISTVIFQTALSAATVLSIK